MDYTWRRWASPLFSNAEPHSSTPSSVVQVISSTLRGLATVDLSQPGLVLRNVCSKALDAVYLQSRHPTEVWRSVHARLHNNRLRDLAWRIAHGALVTNLKRYHWRLGDGLCPRTGCDTLESISHVFWHCSFVLSLWEWFQALADRVTGDRTWSVGHGFVLYGVDPPECSVGVLRRLHFVSVTLKKHIWRNRCDIIFRGRISSWQSVLEAVKSDVKLHIEADFHRLSGAVFAGRWCAGVGAFVSCREGRPLVVL